MIEDDQLFMLIFLSVGMEIQTRYVILDFILTLLLVDSIVLSKFLRFFNILLDYSIVVVFDTCCNGKAELSKGEFEEFKILYIIFCFWLYPTSNTLTDHLNLEWIYSLI